ncbi:alpha/beta fold hydrolase [Microbacterium sp. No. 7]|uniref:alpha/beta fold hydrolase n=1 Tax=Microbacterium sp. No. 7 TaxID=1714373 RepID=UPI0006D28DEA|nr:alpha/beta hydrolase [Microbacterium sp. No. 7]
MTTEPVAPLPVTGTVVSGGARISYGIGGAPDGPPVLLVHGSRAHRHWWARVVPLLAPRCRVAWLDLSGHGDSAHRDRYDADTWAGEVIDVAGELSSSAPVVLVGHSMGGRIAAVAAAIAPPGRFARLVLLEARLWARGETERPPLRTRSSPAVFDDREAAVERFRLSPPQQLDDEPLRSLLAGAALEPAPGGWRWKYDHRGIPPLVGDDILDRLARVDIPVTAAWGSASGIISGPEYARVLAETVSAPLDTHVVPGGGHHLPADSPEATARIISSAIDAGSR